MTEIKKQDKSTGKVPNLRFPGFDGDWETKKLGDIATFSKGKGISKSDIEENGIIECIRYGELYTHYREVIKEIKSKTNVDMSTLVLSEVNDVIIPASGETTIDIATASCVLKSGVALGGDLNIIKTDNNGVFLSYYLNSKKKMEIANLAQGISVVHLYSSQLASLSLSLPKLNEQQRISSFLALLDERIQTQNKIIEELKVLKVTLSKRIFSQELRFKDETGNSFPEWEAIKVGQVYSFKTTNSLSREHLISQDGDVKNIHYGDIHTKFRTLFDITREEVPYIAKSVSLEKVSEENYLKVSDMIFADASEDLNDVGKSIEITNLNNQRVLSGLHTILARPQSGVFSLGFGGYLFKSPEVRIQIKKEAQGSKVLSISSNRLSNVEILIPQLGEQIKITKLLSSMDSKIDIENQLLQKLEEQKKFLSQQMFI